MSIGFARIAHTFLYGWLNPPRPNRSAQIKKIGILPKTCAAHGKQNLLVAAAITFVAQPINKRISTSGDEGEKCYRVVKRGIQLRFSRLQIPGRFGLVRNT